MASSAGIRAGRAFVEIGAVDKTARILARVAQRMKNFGAKMSALGRGAFGTALAGLTPVAMGLKTFTSFDDSMKRVQARSSGTAQEMQNLRDQAKNLGRETKFTASQVGELQAKLAQKGFNRADIAKQTKSVVNLAAAAGSGEDTDTTLAADLVSGTLRAFKMEASESARVADVMSAAVNNGNADLQSLIDGLKSAGPVARQYNLGLEETVAILGTMTNVNIEASSAGVALRNMFLNTSNKALRQGFNKELEKATGKTIEFVDAQGNLKPMPMLLDEIGSAIKDLGTAEQGDILTKLFGKRAVVPASVAQDTKAFGELFEVLSGAHAGNTAEKTAKEMESGMGGAFRSLLSAVQSIGIEIGEALDATFTPFVRWVVEISRSISVWVSENQGLVTSIVGALVTIGAMGAGLMVLGTAISLAGVVLGSLVTLLTSLLSPLVLVPAAVLALVAAWMRWTESGKQSAAILGDAFSMLKKQLGATLGAMVAALKRGDLAQAGKILWLQFQVLWQTGANKLVNIWETVSVRISKVWVDLMTRLKQLWAKTVQGLASLADKIAEAAGMELISPQAVETLRATGNAALRIAQDPESTEEQRKKAQETVDWVKSQLRGKHLSLEGQARAMLGSPEEIQKDGQKVVDLLNDDFAKGVDKREEDLQRLKNRLEIARLEAISPIADEAVKQAEEKVEEVQKELAKTTPTPEATDKPLGMAIQAAERGTSEAVKRALENDKNTMAMLDEMQKQTELLEEIASDSGEDLEGV